MSIIHSSLRSITVRFVTAQRRRSWAWWGVVFLAVVAVGIYVIFDILDVDGSQMAGQLAGEFPAAEDLQAEAGQLVRVEGFSPDSAGLPTLCVSQRSSTEIRGISPSTAKLRTRLSRMFPRVNLHRELARTGTTPPADPA